MNPIDDMFRDGLGSRKGEIPADMWSRVSAGKAPITPEGEGVDQYFSNALKDRTGDVPVDMWSRITATGVPAAAGLDQVFADGLRDRTGNVPEGMWDRIWKARTATPVFTPGRIFAAVAVVLLLLSFGWWMFAGAADGELPAVNNEEVIARDAGTSNKEPAKDSGSAAGAETVGEAGQEKTVARGADRSVGSIKPTARRTIAAAAPDANPAIGNVEQTTANATGAGDPDPNASVPTADDPDQSVSGNQLAGPLESPIEEGEDDTSRTPTAALPALPSNTMIAALDLTSADFKVKKRYQPKTPATHAFRASNRHRLQTEFLFGAFYANQQFSAETDDQRAQRNIREVRENPGLSYQVSLRGAYKLNERLVLRSGLTYSEIRNKFDYERLVNGTPSLLKINNHIRQWEVPVLMGFRVPGRRLNVTLNAGPLVNLTTSVQGRYLHPDSAQPLSLSSDGQYRSNLGVGFMTSLSTTYVIGRKQPFVLLVEPFFKAYPGSYTQDDAPLKEMYWAAGLQLGIRKGF